MTKMFRYYNMGLREFLMVTTRNTKKADCRYVFYDEEGEEEEKGIVDMWPDDEDELEDIAIGILDSYEITADALEEIVPDKAGFPVD